MADSSVPITAGTGTNIDTRTNAAGEHRQVFVLGGDGDNVSPVEAWGQQQVTQGPATLFYDSFTGAALDTTNLWTVASGGTPTVSGGTLTMPATVSTYNAIRSQDLMPLGAGYNDCRMGVQIEATAAVGAGRFWGLAVPPATTPSATSLVQDGAGFEIDQATGNLLAVTYAAGVRTTIATLTRPSDGALHRYSVVKRVTRIYWFVDDLQNSVATIAFPNVTVSNLYATVVRQNAASFTGTPVFAITAAFVADTNRDAQMISDGVVGARRARVGTNGALSVQGVAGGTAVPVSLATNTPTIAAGANQIGTIGELRASTLVVTATSTSGATATASLPTAGAGLFHYITGIDITLYSAAARTGSATPWVVTTTNLPGSPAWTFSTAGAIGANETQYYRPTTPLKATAANTATTVVVPAATGGIWRVIVTYFTAA